ncbi:MAG: type II toxin-antitoxin system RelE/ParE family toxin [Calditrichaeota bacterium]|nr:MAG: type II toxin-antitoxin system RelE/ParE family toxin [Calditrichota bacterium]MBL1204505.1 type II toxin-antitoxin system RelE/ParE family toxin [Calditrichota bacterium]NOG44334.1 type II toxin-antitoxin system RelE/ParE family toxin [Calditrichota bacterium]
MKAIFDPEAQSEFLEAVRYYEDSKEGLGKRYRQSIENAVLRISSSPLLYRIIHPPFRRILLKKFPYAIIYTIEPDHIRIIAIAHTKRKPGYWLK